MNISNKYSCQYIVVYNSDMIKTSLIMILLFIFTCGKKELEEESVIKFNGENYILM